MAAAANEAPDQQAAMIQGMVDGLAARLKKDGSDLDGWVRLVRSYKVLGQPDKAQSAIADAQRALAGDPDKRQRLDIALKELETGTAATPASRTGSASQSGRRIAATRQRHDAGNGGPIGGTPEKIRVRSRRVDHAHPVLSHARR